MSVVIPVRNGEATIERAVGSVLAQTVRPWEVLVVDDGSSDATRDRVRTFDGDVTLITEEGRGVAAARNQGIEHASGDWVAFLDGDDHWERSLLDRATRRIRQAPGALACFCAAIPVDDRGAPVGLHAVPAEIRLADLIRGDVVPTTSAALVHREATLGAGGFYEGFRCKAGVEDLDLWWRLAAIGRCVGVSEPVAIYHVHDQRARSAATHCALLECDRNDVVRRLAARHDADRLLPRARAVMRAGTARYWLRAGQPAPARRAAISSLRACPTASGLLTLAAALTPPSVRDSAVRVRRRRRGRRVARA